MRSNLPLQDRSVLLYGPFNGLTQNLIREFTEKGADVGMLHPELAGLTRFVESINDVRVAHPEFGRAAALNIEVTHQTAALDAVTRIAEIFGRIDILVDCDLQSLANEKPSLTRMLIEHVTPYFKSKKRGRIVFIREDDILAPLLKSDNFTNENKEFSQWMESLAQEWPNPSFSVNMLTIGLTEDFLIKKFPQSKSIRESFEKVRSEHPKIHLVDYNDISSVGIFLSGTGTTGLSGQILRVTREAKL